MALIDYRELGSKIRKIRKEQKLTQSQLARAAGISASFIAHVERDTRVASLETIVTLCNTLGVSPDYLLSHELQLNGRPVSAGLSSEELDTMNRYLSLSREIVDLWS